MKEAITVRLTTPALMAAKFQAQQKGISVSAVICELAEEHLLGDPLKIQDRQLGDAIERLAHRIEHHARLERQEFTYLKEFLGMFLRSYLNHTSAVPGMHRDAAILSGRDRFVQLLDVLVVNLRSGRSVLAESDRAAKEEKPQE